MKSPDELAEHETFAQRCFSKSVSVADKQADEQFYACVYRDFGAWRAVADYRNKRIWIKYAAMQTDQCLKKAGERADELAVELVSYLAKAGVR